MRYIGMTKAIPPKKGPQGMATAAKRQRERPRHKEELPPGVDVLVDTAIEGMSPKDLRKFMKDAEDIMEGSRRRSGERSAVRETA
jgi:hypothetical protein